MDCQVYIADYVQQTGRLITLCYSGEGHSSLQSVMQAEAGRVKYLDPQAVRELARELSNYYFNALPATTIIHVYNTQDRVWGDIPRKDLRRITLLLSLYADSL